MSYIFQKITIEKLIWDEWNITHISRHQIKYHEVEQACYHYLKALKTYNNRIMILGQSNNGKLITVILAKQIKNNYYVVTARNMSKEERKFISND